MPGSFLIDTERRIIFSKGWGVLTREEIALHVAALKSDPRFDPAFRQLVDFRGLTGIQVTSNDVRGFASITPFRRDSRRAFVVGTDEAFGLLRMFGTYLEADASHFGIFRELGPAMEWVGLDVSEPWPVRAPDRTFGEG